MTLRRIALATWLALAFFAAHALGQTAPDRRDVVERVHAACPGLVRQDHAFTDAVASVLTSEDARWGRNGKRGNAGDPSHDAIAYRDARGPGGVTIVDIIAAAGGPDARPAWQDVTQATRDAGTIGAWVRPSGVLPACLSGATVPPVVTPPPVVHPPPQTDLTEVLAALARIDARLADLERRQPPDLGTLAQYVDAMVGVGPPGGTGPHVTDIKQRLDVLRVQIEQMNAWLRSRSALRF